MYSVYIEESCIIITLQNEKFTKVKNSRVLIGCLVVVVKKILNTGATVTLLNSEGFVFATVKVSVVVSVSAGAGASSTA